VRLGRRLVGGGFDAGPDLRGSLERRLGAADDFPYHSAAVGFWHPPIPFDSERKIRHGVAKLLGDYHAEARALQAFTRRYPHGDRQALESLLADLRADGPIASRVRGLDLATIDPAALIERLIKDPRIIDFDQWLHENRGSMEAAIHGVDGRLDHLSELREAEVRLQALPPDGVMSVAENEIPGTDRYADLKSNDAYVEVKTVREPLTAWLGVTGQLSNALQKFSKVEDDGRDREAVVYVVLDPRLHEGIAHGNVRTRYLDGDLLRNRIDTGEPIHSEPFWQPLEEWINNLAMKIPVDNPGILKADRVHVRCDGGVSATLERRGAQWALLL
jgi:hypothetical protein